MSATDETHNNVSYFVNDAGVLIQASRGASGGEHLRFIYDVPGLQAAPRQLHMHPQQHEPRQARAPARTANHGAGNNHNARQNVPKNAPQRFITPAPQANVVPGSAMNTPRRPPPLQASPRMERQTPVVDRVLRQGGRGLPASNIVPSGRERMEREVDMIRQQVEEEHEMGDRLVFYAQKKKMEKRRDEARLAMEYDKLGIRARETSDVDTRHLTPSDSSQFSSPRAQSLQFSSSSDGTPARERVVNVETAPSFHSREVPFPRDDALMDEFDAILVDDRSRATTPAYRCPSPRDDEVDDSLRRASYEPYVVVNNLHAAFQDDESSSSFSTLSSLTDLSEVSRHGSAGNTPGPVSARLAGNSFCEGSSRSHHHGVHSTNSPVRIKREMVEPTIMTRSKAKGKARNE